MEDLPSLTSTSSESLSNDEDHSNALIQAFNTVTGRDDGVHLALHILLLFAIIALLLKLTRQKAAQKAEKESRRKALSIEATDTEQDLASLFVDDPLTEWLLEEEETTTGSRWPLFVQHLVIQGKGKQVNPFHLVADRLQSFSDRLFHTFLPLKHPSLDKAARHLMQAGGGGKKIRPTMVYLIAKALPPTNTTTTTSTSTTTRALDEKSAMTDEENQVTSLLQGQPEDPNVVPMMTDEDMQDTLAQVVESFHTASLLHDDVLDEADTRRGDIAAHKLTGSKIAILAGECLLSKGFRVLSQACKHRPRGPQVVQVMATCVEYLAHGEVLQLGDQGSMDNYLRKTFHKAGSLMAGACMSVALLGDHPRKVVYACYRYGKHLGIAFQLADDILDFSGKDLGKPILNDLKEGLATAPVLFAAEEYDELWPLIHRRFSHDGDVERAASFVKKSKGIERTEELARRHAEFAIQAIMELGRNEYVDGLRVMAIMAVTRKH